jgi:surface polysaccharide O-acyltransferase-like enzyme
MVISFLHFVVVRVWTQTVTFNCSETSLGMYIFHAAILYFAIRVSVFLLGQSWSVTLSRDLTVFTALLKRRLRDPGRCTFRTK